MPSHGLRSAGCAPSVRRVSTTTILWLRTDLRLGDHPALDRAVRGSRVVPLYIWAPEEEEPWAPGAASRWWLAASLRALSESLAAAGSRLVVRRGPSLETLRAVAGECGADSVVWSERHEPAVRARDDLVAAALATDGIRVERFESSLLVKPAAGTKPDGSPYRVFTPFWKSLLARAAIEAPLPAPKRVPPPAAWPSSLAIDDLALEPKLDWTAGMHAAWAPGEAGARAAFSRFVAGPLAGYAVRRDHPGIAGTSRLSAHLHFGEISAREMWTSLRGIAADRHDPDFDRGAEAWLRQIAWREFAHHLLRHYPHTTDAPLRPEFSRMRDRGSDQWLAAWQRGRTGYPLVDAGMRELWTTGWMHNRVRMVAASFLVKHLGIAWQDGARWFWDALVDADLANNTLGWQWVAGCGADAAPYFRIFNPTLQSRRFDPDGRYLRRWLPELARLDSRWIHEPASAPPGALEAAGVALGSTYPQPIVAHDRARRLALEAYEELVRARA